jgi:SAM-dependent methyltransferase
MRQFIDIEFRSLQDWMEWWQAHRIEASQIDQMGEEILLSGFVDPLTKRRIGGEQIRRGANWREGIVHEGINSRMRAVLFAIEELARESAAGTRIYATEAVTSFALRLRGIYPRFIGSEFTENPRKRAELFPIQWEDLTRLSFLPDSFDIVSTNEVLEHVPDLDRSLSEIARVLKPGGWHVGTHPFRFMSSTSMVKARLVDGAVSLLTEPEYHGDPMSDAGSLVFEIPGWDIIERCRKAGFSDAAMRFILSIEHGILSTHAGGIFLLMAKK